MTEANLWCKVQRREKIKGLLFLTKNPAVCVNFPAQTMQQPGESEVFSMGSVPTIVYKPNVRLGSNGSALRSHGTGIFYSDMPVC